MTTLTTTHDEVNHGHHTDEPDADAARHVPVLLAMIVVTFLLLAFIAILT